MGIPGLAPCGAGGELIPDCNPLFDQASAIRYALAEALVADGWSAGTPNLVSHGPAFMPIPPNCDQLDVWVSSIARIPLLKGKGMRTETTYSIRLAIGCWPTIVDTPSGEPALASPASQEYAAMWSTKWATTLYDNLLVLKPMCHQETFVVAPVIPNDPSGGCATWTTSVKW